MQRGHRFMGIPKAEFGLGTPRQKLGITFHIIDQRIHLGRRMFDQDSFLDERHNDNQYSTREGLLECRILAKSNRTAPSSAPIFDVSMSIVSNKKAFHDYFIEEKFVAGVSLEGWECKAIRAGRVQIKEAYVVVLEGELYLLGMHITPLISASTHVKPDAIRTRKLLLHRRQIDTLIGKVERAGYALVPIDLHYSKGRIKAEIGLAKGKKLHDKRDSEKEKDWKREQGRLLKTQVR